MKRVHYYTGMLLSAEDLQAEQDYQREKCRLHNRCLHGYGVACGLAVSVWKGSVRVSPGVALSCTGDEIVVSNTIPLRPEIAEELPQLKVLSVAPMLAEAIRRIHLNMSVSALFGPKR